VASFSMRTAAMGLGFDGDPVPSPPRDGHCRSRPGRHRPGLCDALSLVHEGGGRTLALRGAGRLLGPRSQGP